MSSNSPKMTLEERIVQTIKSDTLMALVGDEDAITELTKRAIHEALYQPQKVVGPYSTSTIDSPVVAAARDVAKKAAEQVSKEMIEELCMRADFRAAVRQAIAEIMPATMEAFCLNMVGQVTSRAKVDAVVQVQEIIRNKQMPGL